MIYTERFHRKLKKSCFISHPFYGSEGSEEWCVNDRQRKDIFIVYELKNFAVSFFVFQKFLFFHGVVGEMIGDDAHSPSETKTTNENRNENRESWIITEVLRCISPNVENTVFLRELNSFRDLKSGRC